MIFNLVKMTLYIINRLSRRSSRRSGLEEAGIGPCQATRPDLHPIRPIHELVAATYAYFALRWSIVSNMTTKIRDETETYRWNCSLILPSSSAYRCPTLIKASPTWIRASSTFRASNCRTCFDIILVDSLSPASTGWPVRSVQKGIDVFVTMTSSCCESVVAAA